MHLIGRDKADKVMFIVVNCALAIVWTRFLVSVIGQWESMKLNIRDDVGLFMFFSVVCGWP